MLEIAPTPNAPTHPPPLIVSQAEALVTQLNTVLFAFSHMYTISISLSILHHFDTFLQLWL